MPFPHLSGTVSHLVRTSSDSVVHILLERHLYPLLYDRFALGFEVLVALLYELEETFLEWILLEVLSIAGYCVVLIIC